jgi:hypothetical protein
MMAPSLQEQPPLAVEHQPCEVEDAVHDVGEGVLVMSVKDFNSV